MAWLLFLLACPLVSEADLAARLDGDGDGVPRPGDCDDGDPAVGTASTFYADADGDGFGTTSERESCSTPVGFASEAGDCDDSRASSNPAAVEVCNGVDDDCEGSSDGADAADALPWYADADADGFGDPQSLTIACEAPEEGWIHEPGDCDDSSAAAFPGGVEVWYDGVDGDCLGGNDYDADADGFESDDFAGDDCDDTSEWVSPARTEACGDGVDNDCDGLSTACAWEGEMSLNDADGVLFAGYEQDDFGGALAFVGDTNGDGLNEMLIGASNEDGYGAAWLVNGAPAGEQVVDDAGFKIRSEIQGYLGSAVAAAGDIDGDGFDDVLVSIPYVHGPGPDYPSSAGAVLFVHGPIEADVTLADGAPGFYGTVERLFLGRSIAAADLDGDGGVDLAASYYSDGGADAGFSEGGVFVLRGPLEGTSTTDDAVQMPGDDPDAHAGYFALVAGEDVDGDGLHDLAVDAGVGTTGQISRVYIIPGPADTSAPIADVGFRFDGVEELDEAGHSVVLPGDLDGDGYGELVVGASEANSTTTSGKVGAVYLVHGPITGGGALGDAVDRIEAAMPSRGLGAFVDAGADVNGDGRNDLVVTASGCGSCTWHTAAYVVLSPVVGTALAETDALAWVDWPNPFSGTISSIALADDLDGDGGADLVLGFPWSNTGGAQFGAVYYLLGGPAE